MAKGNNHLSVQKTPEKGNDLRPGTVHIWTEGAAAGSSGDPDLISPQNRFEIVTVR